MVLEEKNFLVCVVHVMLLNTLVNDFPVTAQPPGASYSVLVIDIWYTSKGPEVYLPQGPRKLSTDTLCIEIFSSMFP